MLKMVIEFDEAKIDHENRYDLQDFTTYLKDLAERRGLRCCENGVYAGTGRDEDLVQFMVIMSILKTTDWFLRYVSKWLWYEDDDTGEDLIKSFKIAG